ncbi:MAG: hypothetical protein JWM16_3286 [Verrucomicrobiales bacterium]|nr:hypothetical protein [Verrucomicrobiales bacterium]
MKVEDLQSTAAKPSKTQSQAGSNLTRAAVILLLVLVAAGLFLLLPPTAPLPPPVVLLHGSFPKDGPTLFERFVPMKPGWGWAWKLREVIVGRPKRIDMVITVMDCPELPGTRLPGFPLEQPSFADTNGLQVWILANSDLAVVTDRIKQLPGSQMLSRPRISTSSGVGCSMQSDNTGVSILAYGHPERTDLYARFIQTETQHTGIPAFSVSSLETNLDAGLRLQMSNGNGLLLLNLDPKTQRRTAVALSLSFPKGK